MDSDKAFVLISVIFNGMLVGMIAFFLKQLIGRFDRVETSLNTLSKELAVMAANHAHHESRFVNLERAEERMDKETKSVRERLHHFGNDLHKLSIQTEVCREFKESHE